MASHDRARERLVDELRNAVGEEAV